MESVKFNSILIKPSDHGGWHFLQISKDVGDRFEKKDGTRRVVCSINGSEPFPCALLPSGGDFIIVVNKAHRTKLKIVEGDTVAVELRRDESKYGMPMPPDFREVLDQDPAGDKLFHALTPGKQRSILYFVGKIKDIDRRIHAALVFIEHLKKNAGKINHLSLQKELKRPAMFE